VIACEGSLDVKRRLIAAASRLVSGDALDDTPSAEEIAWIDELQTFIPKRKSLLFPEISGRELNFSGELENIDSAHWRVERKLLVELGVEINPVKLDGPLKNLGVLFEATDQSGAVIAEGYSINRMRAFSRVIGEATERRVAEFTDFQRSWLTTGNALKANRIKVPNIHVGSRDAYSENAVLDWCAASTVYGLPAAIPAELAFYNFSPKSGVVGFNSQTTAGLAAGRSIETVTFTAIREVVERDCLWLTMRWGLNCQTIDHTVFASDASKVILKRLLVYGFIVHVKNISIDSPIPIIHVLLESRNGDLPAFCRGTGSSLSIEKAALKALEEAVQSLQSLRKCLKDPKFFSESVFPHSGKSPDQFWSDPASRQFLLHLMQNNHPEQTPTANQFASSPALAIKRLVKSDRMPFYSILGQIGRLHVVRAVLENSQRPVNEPLGDSFRIQKWARSRYRMVEATTPIIT
jgi:YcaO-like protein with predicted kinase domain